MKIKAGTSDRLITSDRSIAIAIFGAVFSLLLLSIPHWATTETPPDVIRSMRWTAYVCIAATIWTATSTHLILDAQQQQIKWHRRFVPIPFLPLLNRSIAAPLSTASEVKLTLTRSHQTDLANLTLLLSDGRELRITHASTSPSIARDAQTRINEWLQTHT